MKKGVKKGSAQARSFAERQNDDKTFWTLKVIAYTQQEIMQKYEPKCYKLCMNVFRESYELTKKYREFVACEKQEQRSLFDP